MGKFVGTFLLLISSTFSASGEVEDLLSRSLQELMLIPITGSTLNEEILANVPSAVTVFTRQEISALGVEYLDELIQLVPGYQSYRSSNSPLDYVASSRGRRISSPMAEILLIIDGQRITDSRTSGSGGFFKKYPLSFIERVEFIRGPGAAIYGSNAMTGIINVVTRSQENSLKLGAGSFSRKDVNVLSSYQWNDMKLDFLAYAVADSGQDYLVNDSFSPGKIETDDPTELAHVNIKVNKRHTYLNLQHHQFNGWNFYSTGNVANDINFFHARVSSVSLKQEFEWQQMSSWLWLSYNEVNVVQRAQLSAPGALSPVSNPSSDEALKGKVFLGDDNESRVQWHNTWNYNSKNSFLWGIEYRQLDVPDLLSQTNFDLVDIAQNVIPIQFYDGDPPKHIVQAASTRDIFGVYGQHQSKLTDALKLTLGLRYDAFSNVGDKLSPRLGLVQAIGDTYRLKLLYGEAFRAPSEEEMNARNNPFLLGNENLKPETVKTYELIWLNQQKEFSYSLGYFENHYFDSIVRKSVSPGRDQYLNTDQSPTKGIEFELNWELNENWYLRGSYTSLFENSDLSYREADHFGSLSFTFQQARWSANLIASHVGDRQMLIEGSSSELITLNGYWQLYGKVKYKISNHWQSYLQVKNIGDKDYRTPAVDTDVSEGVINRGREILFVVDYSF